MKTKGLTLWSRMHCTFNMLQLNLNLQVHCLFLLILGALWTGGFPVWLQYLTRWRVNPYTWTDCKVMYPLFFFTSQYSSSLLMAMSVEKCFALYFPLPSKSVCTVRTAKKFSLTAAFVLFGFNLHLIFVRDAETDSDGKKQCIWGSGTS